MKHFTGNELYHHGIKGQRWGIRRFQKKDGSLTPAGEKRYLQGDVSRHRNDGIRSIGRISPGKDGKMSLDNVKKLNAEILKDNPNAAVVDYSILNEKKYKAAVDEDNARIERNKKIRNVAIGVGVLTVAAAGVYYVKNKDVIDAKVKDVLNKRGNETLADVMAKDTPLSSLEKNRYASLGLNVNTHNDSVRANWLSNWLYQDVHRYDAISEDDYLKRSTEDVVLKAGQKFKRVSHSPETSLNVGAYVSYEPDDVERYKAFLPTMWSLKGNLDMNSVYSVDMKAKGVIKSPSAQKRIDILAELYLEHNPGLSKSDAHTIALQRYNQVATGFNNRDSKLTQQYFAKVKELGYNAIIDDNDAGRLAKSPMILLDPSVIKMGEATKLTPDDIKMSFNKIKSMTNETRDSFNEAEVDKRMLYVWYNAAQRFAK